MEGFRSDVDNVTFNGTLNVDGTSMTTSLLENAHAPISANTGSEERSTDVVNPNMETIIPENESGLMEEAEVGRHQLRACQQAILELRQNARSGFRARSPLLNVNLHKYKATNSTCPETKENCCICLVEYFDGEELAKINCGHIYHTGCIKEWNLRDNTCPICKRRVSVVSHFTLRISAFLAHKAAANHLSSGSMN